MAAVPGRRRKRPAALFGVLAGLLLLATSLTGCGDKYPAHVAPGSYVVQINATGTPAGATTPCHPCRYLSPDRNAVSTRDAPGG